MMIGKLFGTAPVLKKQLEVYQPKFGDLNLGYDGAFPSTALVSRQTLMGMVGATDIVRMYGHTADWLKFYLNGKTLWVASSPVGVTTHYNNLMARGLLTGTRTVTIDGKVYKVRALTGGNGNASEWNRLLYRIAAGSPIPTADRWAEIPAVSLTAASDGKTYIYSISPDLVGSNVSLRGKDTIQAEFSIGPTNTYSDIGWRPVLELIS